MAGTNLDSFADQPWLDEVGKPLSEMVLALFRSGGAAGQAAKNALHGVWLGHPLHPVLTDVPIGAWTTALALDAREVATGDAGYGRAAGLKMLCNMLRRIRRASTPIFRRCDPRCNERLDCKDQVSDGSSL